MPMLAILTLILCLLRPKVSSSPYKWLSLMLFLSTSSRSKRNLGFKRPKLPFTRDLAFKVADYGSSNSSAVHEKDLARYGGLLSVAKGFSHSLALSMSFKIWVWNGTLELEGSGGPWQRELCKPHFPDFDNLQITTIEILNDILLTFLRNYSTALTNLSLIDFSEE